MSAIAIAADDVQARTVAETMLGLVADDGHVEVAKAELARLTGLSVRTLHRTLARLREAHWISVVREATPNAPKRYDLTDLADVAQAVGLKPRRETPLEALRRLDAVMKMRKRQTAAQKRIALARSRARRAQEGKR